MNISIQIQDVNMLVQEHAHFHVAHCSYSVHIFIKFLSLLFVLLIDFYSNIVPAFFIVKRHLQWKAEE